jgi:hypothetical protein
MEPLKQPQLPPAIPPRLSVGSAGRDLWQDVRYAIRAVSKQPAFAAAAILTLALGIGATTAIFTVVYGVLLKPLPFHEPERLVSLTHVAPHGAGANHGPGTYLTYRENHHAFEGIGAWDPTRRIAMKVLIINPDTINSVSANAICPTTRASRVR